MNRLKVTGRRGAYRGVSRQFPPLTGRIIMPPSSLISSNLCRLCPARYVVGPSWMSRFLGGEYCRPRRKSGTGTTTGKEGPANLNRER